MGDTGPSDEALNEILQSLKNYRISKKRIKIINNESVGFGGFGEVKLATLRGKHPRLVDGANVAVKQLRASGDSALNKRIVFRCVRELRVWADLDHENILELVGFYLSGDMETAWLLSPYEERGNVREYLDKTKPSELERLRLVLDSAEGLAYLHRRNICHGDIKGGNVLVTADGRAKLCDFGMAKLLGVEPSGITTSKGFKGSIRWMAPEIIEADKFIRTLESDVWAWACLDLEILCDILPYADAEIDSAVVCKIVRDVPPASLDALLLPDVMKVLLQQCWTHQPDSRPSIRQCVYVISSSVLPIKNPAIQQPLSPADVDMVLSRPLAGSSDASGPHELEYVPCDRCIISSQECELGSPCLNCILTERGCTYSTRDFMAKDLQDDDDDDDEDDGSPQEPVEPTSLLEAITNPHRHSSTKTDSAPALRTRFHL